MPSKALLKSNSSIDILILLERKFSFAYIFPENSFTATKNVFPLLNGVCVETHCNKEVTYSVLINWVTGGMEFRMPHLLCSQITFSLVPKLEADKQKPYIIRS